MALRHARRALLVVVALCASVVDAPNAAADGSPLPVLLVHGWHGLGEDTLAGSSLAPLGERLAADGHDVAWAAGIGADPGETLEEAAGTLGRGVVALGEASGKPVVIVAHSYGGIVARAYLEGEGYARDFAAGVRVASLVTLGTPMAGIDVWLPLLMILGDPIGEPSTWQLTPAWMSAFNAAHRPRPDVRMTAIAGDARAQAWPLRLLPASDGVVTLASALALDERRYAHVERLTDDVHSSGGPFAYFGWHDYMSHGPTYRDAVRPGLRGLGSGAFASAGRAFAEADQDAASHPMAWHALDVARGPATRAADGTLDEGTSTPSTAAPARAQAAAYVVAAGRRAADDGSWAGDVHGDGPGASTRAGAGERAASTAALRGALSSAAPGEALDLGWLSGTAGHGAILAGTTGSASAPPLTGDGAWFALYSPDVPHPEVMVTQRPRGLHVTVSASDGRPLAPTAVRGEVIGGTSRAIAFIADGAGALVADLALPAGMYQVRVVVSTFDRDLEALVTASVPAEDGARALSGAWCDVSRQGASAHVVLDVRAAGHYLVAIRGLDRHGQTVASTAGWRDLDAGSNAIALFAPSAGKRIARLIIETFEADDGLVPAGGGDIVAGDCADWGALGGALSAVVGERAPTR